MYQLPGVFVVILLLTALSRRYRILAFCLLQILAVPSSLAFHTEPTSCNVDEYLTPPLLNNLGNPAQNCKYSYTGYLHSPDPHFSWTWYEIPYWYAPPSGIYASSEECLNSGLRQRFGRPGPYGDAKITIDNYWSEIKGHNPGKSSCCLSSYRVDVDYPDPLNTDVSIGVYFLSCKKLDEEYTIRLSTDKDEVEDENTITSVEPKHNTRPKKNEAELLAQVYDKNGEKVPNVKVKLELSSIEDTGGHIEEHHTKRPNNQKGKLVNKVTGANSSNDGILQGTTDSVGFSRFAFRFEAPEVAGDYKIVASCIDRICTQVGPDLVWVGIKNLDALFTSDYYNLIGRTDPHPDNHYMTFNARVKVSSLAFLYNDIFPDDPVLHLNDASLERGGLFDLASNWTIIPGHETHRFGNIIDIRFNPQVNPDSAIPLNNRFEFFDLVSQVGGRAEIHSPNTDNQHFHVNFY